MTDGELNELVMAHLQGSASTAQQARLEALLAAEPENMQRYIQYVRESAIMSTSMSGGDPKPHASQARGISPPKHRQLGSARDGVAVDHTTLSSRRRSSRPGLWWAMAAAVVVAVFTSQYWRHIPGDNAPDVNQPIVAAADATAGSAPDVVARIIRKVDCVWEDEKWSVQSTSMLRRGQMLRVSQGMMEIEFNCGARVALQGPARFTVAGPKNGLFHSGRLTAMVPERARGFSIKAPTTNVIDLGTSFSLRVQEDGLTEIHVIDGEVISQPLDRTGAPRGKEMRLHGQDALLVSLDGEESIAFKDSPKFLRNDEQQARGPAEWDVSVADQLVLWLSADHDVERDSRGGVWRWGDRLYGGNTHSEMAWQFEAEKRPRWMPRAMDGRPALRFDGKSTFLVTDALATSDEQTVMFVVSAKPWTPPEERRFISRQIMNYNGPPNFALQFVEGNRFSCWNFAPTAAEMLKHDGEFESNPLPANKPLLIAYTYSLKHEYAELMINGKSQGRVSATEPAAIDSPKYIGCHWSEVQHLHGDLAELLVFNEALSLADAAEVTGYLSRKYGVPLEPIAE